MFFVVLCRVLHINYCFVGLCRALHILLEIGQYTSRQRPGFEHRSRTSADVGFFRCRKPAALTLLPEVL